MGPIRKVISKNHDKASKNEPFAAIRYNGSYSCALTVLRMIGLNNLNLTEGQRLNDGYDLVEQLMDKDSNLKVPEIFENEEMKLLSRRPLTLYVDSWMVFEVGDSGYTEVVFYPNGEFNSKYSIKE